MRPQLKVGDDQGLDFLGIVEPKHDEELFENSTETI